MSTSSSSSGPSSGFWRNQLRQWHWISSALCLSGLLLFAATGFTLNHAADIEAKPKTTHIDTSIPAADLPLLDQAHDKAPLPAALVTAVKTATGISTGNATAEVSDDDIYVDLSQPGVDASITIDKPDGHVAYDRTGRGLIAVLNDLHKGRHAGPVWGLFIDGLALACVVFSVTGLGLLWLHARGRRITWPLVAAGLALPLILFLLFIHV